MTLRARQVLSDCRLALDLLEIDDDLDTWRVHWVAAMALLRTVGYVLKDIDGRDPQIRRIADEAHRQWKRKSSSHRVFRDFISRDRNNIIHRYDFNVDMNEHVNVLVSVNPDVDIEPPLDTPRMFSLDENLFRPITGDYGEGEDARDIVAEAIGWWDEQLTKIEESLPRRP